MDGRIEVLLDRIELLERANRVHRRVAGVGALVLLAACGNWGTDEGKVHELIRAKKIEVVNNEGQAMVVANAMEDGGWLTVRNNEGKPVVDAVAIATGGVLRVWNNEGRPVVGADARENGGRLSVLNKTGKQVVTLTVDEYGNGEVGAWDHKGKGRTLQPGN